MPRWAWGPSAHSSASSRPPVPITRIGNMNDVVRKPVP